MRFIGSGGRPLLILESVHNIVKLESWSISESQIFNSKLKLKQAEKLKSHNMIVIVELLSQQKRTRADA